MKYAYPILILFSTLFFIQCDKGKNSEGKQGISDNYFNTGRYLWQKPEMVLNLFGDLRGKTVADIGAGNGFFTFRLAEKAKRVIAIDINEDFIYQIEKQTPAAVKEQVETRLVSPSSPNLKDEEADAVLLVNTYMYLDNRVDYLKKVHKGMALNGMILINDFKKKQTTVGPNPNVRVPLYQVEKELKQAGFQVITTDDTSLEYQYIVVARKK